MRKKSREIVYSAIIAALYAVLCYMQNVLVPNSASFAIQFRAAEALCVLAFFTPAAIPGLTVGCIIFNISAVGALPLDVPLGGLATLLAAWVMYGTRRMTIKGYPLLGMLMPALTNAVLIGWELQLFVGGSFWINALYVAVGELVVLLTLGTALFYAIKSRRLLDK